MLLFEIFRSHQHFSHIIFRNKKTHVSDLRYGKETRFCVQDELIYTLQEMPLRSLKRTLILNLFSCSRQKRLGGVEQCFLWALKIKGKKKERENLPHRVYYHLSSSWYDMTYHTYFRSVL